MPRRSPAEAALHFKDAGLDALATSTNVAQFVSYDPLVEQRFSRVQGFTPNHRFASVSDAAMSLLRSSAEGSVNVRSFDPASPKSKEFVYGLRDVSAIEASIVRLAGEGLYTILNETIDIHDGGVSGVALGDVLEFAPGDTPRAVEKPGTLQVQRSLGIRLLEIVYGFRPQLRFAPSRRVEFSIHPIPRGYRREHTVVWEVETVGRHRIDATVRWPNRFSRHIGDKAFGLLMAELAGLPVPRTVVVGRHLPPFAFGRDTGCGETWIRTCPKEQVPGKYTTHRGWLDPFKLLQDEDPSGTEIASVLAQAGVEARYSGALMANERVDGAIHVMIEGTVGFGDDFMAGRRAPVRLPPELLRDVESLYRDAESSLGPVRMEWVADSRVVWVIQMHRGTTMSSGNIVYPGHADAFVEFNIERGIEALRDLVEDVRGTAQGIALVGNVGLTSHFGDILRRARIPSRLLGSSQSERE